MVNHILIAQIEDAIACSDVAVDIAQKIEREQWQPIDTAPVNESVLIYLPNLEHYGPGIYRAILCDMGTGKRWHTTAYACGRDLDPREWPKWWMRLPSIPVSDAIHE